MPFEQVVEIAQPPRRLDHTPLFQVLLAWQNHDEGTLALPDLRVEPLPTTFNAVKFDLELVLSETTEGTVAGSLNYVMALFDAATVERYRGYLLQVLRAIVADAAQPIARIDLLDDAERTLLLQSWNQTDTPYPQGQCIHHLFEQQVLRTSDAVALVFDNQSLTYAQLNAQANQLAHYLMVQGIGPDDRVALCVERGTALVVGLLAILKAGGAYLPLDPVYASER
ncbi:AMP-binding protein, partial [Dyella mobilis]|uniref:AMP-binding protein n=1 Tax=Dyella mobilis TaxID=1849582 RepID=UPI0027BA19FC